MKKRRLILYIIAIISLILIITLVTVYFLRNTIIRSILEKSLSKKLETQVQIEGFNLQFFPRSTVDIDSFSIVKKDDKNVYLVKTGTINITLGPILPMIFDKKFEFYNIEFNSVYFLVPKNRHTDTDTNVSQVKQAGIDSLLDSIDINTLLENYTNTLQSLDYAQSLLVDTEKYGKNLHAQLTKINNISNTVKKDLDAFSSVSLNSLEEANTIVKQAQKSYAKIKKAYNDSINIKHTLLSNKSTLENSVDNLNSLVNKDIANITKDIANPKQLATDLSTSVLTQMLSGPVTKYHAKLSAILEFLQDLQDKNNVKNSFFPLKQFLNTLSASIQPYIPSQFSTYKQKEDQTITKNIASDTFIMANIQNIDNINTDIPVASVPEVPTVPDIRTKNTDKNSELKTTNIVAQNNTNNTNSTETASNKKNISIDIQTFTLSMGVKETHLFTLRAMKLTIHKNMSTTPPIHFRFHRSNENAPIIENGQFSLNPNFPMLTATINSGDIPITIDTGLEYIQVKKLQSNTSFRLDINMDDAKNGTVNILLTNKELTASPTEESDSVVTNAINDASSIDIETDISIKNGKVHNLSFHTNIINAIMLPLVEKNLQIITNNIEKQLKTELYKQATVDIDSAKALVNEQLQEVNMSIQNSEEIKELQKGNVSSIEKTVQNYITQQANVEAEKIKKQLEEEQNKIQKELEEQTENIIKDLGSSFGF